MLQDKQTNKSFHHFFCLQKTKKASDSLFSEALIIYVSRFNCPGASVYLFFSAFYLKITLMENLAE